MSLTALIYLLVFFAGIAATVIYSPIFGILLYELQYLVNPPGRWWYGDLPSLRYSFFIMVLVVASYLLRVGEYRRNRFLAYPQSKWLAAMTLVILVTYLWALDPELHLDTTIRYLKVLLFVVVAFKVTDATWKLESVLGAYLLGIGYLSFIIWQTGRTGSGRLEGIGSADGTDANGAASLVVTAIPILVFYALFARRSWQKVASLGGLAFTLNALILLNSRGAFLALALAGAYFCLFVFREKGLKGQKFKTVAGIAAAACLFVYLADDVFWARMSTMTEVSSTEEVETHSRLDYWKKTPEMLGEHPLGGGAQTYKILSPLYLPKEWLSGGRRVVHSTWFEVLSEYGYHGLFIFLGYVISTFMLAKKVRGRLREYDDTYHLFQCLALESAWLASLIACSFINSFYSEITYWLPMFIAAFAGIHLRREAEPAAAGEASR